MTSRSIWKGAGVEFELRQPEGVDAAEELLAAMIRDDAGLLGVRHRNPW